MAIVLLDFTLYLWHVADFLVGAHALLQADRLMTLDPDRHKQDFPELRL